MNAHVYTGRETNWTTVITSSVLTIPLVGLAADGAIDMTVVVVALLVGAGVLGEVLTGADVRVACGTSGLSVHWGFLGWPRARYALDDIADISIVSVPWWAISFGLWWTPWRTVCTVRSGPALRLRLHSGRTVTVTVPDPRAALDALEDARTRA